MANNFDDARIDIAPASGIRERNKCMVNNSLLSDVTFLVHDSRSNKEIEVYAHKYVLSIASPVFQAMFYGALASEGAQRIPLPDCDAESLKEFLSYLYCDEVCMSEDNVMQLLYLAKKYLVPSLHQMACQKLLGMLTVDNVFEILPWILPQLGDKGLVKRCWEIIEFDTEQAINSESFCDIDRDVLEQVLERDGLTIREVHLFRRVLDWAKEKQILNNRNFLEGKVMKLIRFPTMSSSEFSQALEHAGALNKNTMELYNIHPDSLGVYARIPRGQTFRCKRFHAISSPMRRFKWRLPWEITQGWNYERGLVDSVTFSAEVPILLCGVRLFGNRDATYLVEMKIFPAASDENTTENPAFPDRLSTEGTFLTDKNATLGYYGFDVPIYPPVYLKNNVNVVIEVVLRGPASYSGDKGLRSLDCEGVRFHFSDKPSANGTNAMIGQFAEIKFKTVL